MLAALFDDTKTLSSVFENSKQLSILEDVSADAILDPLIKPQNPVTATAKPTPKPPRDSEYIFLTGVTGFVGSFLLLEVLESTDATAICLVRCQTANQGLDKIKAIFEDYNLWDDSFLDRLLVFSGDLELPNLGLTEEQLDYIATKVDTIYHCGAIVNHIQVLLNSQFFC